MAKANILLVEDDTVQALETKNYLENSGYEVIVAANGKSALKAAKTHIGFAAGGQFKIQAYDNMILFIKFIYKTMKLW